jgi:hypothetical protein
LIKGTVSWFRADKQFGVLVSENGVEYGFHLNQYAGFTSLVLKEDDVTFKPELSPCFSPQKGDPIVFSENGRRVRDKLRVEIWGYHSEYLSAKIDASARMDNIHKLASTLSSHSEKIRIRFNPRFRLLEAKIENGHRKGDQSDMILFQGTKADYDKRLNEGGYPPLVGKNIGGVQKIRRWEMESQKGWAPCADPNIYHLGRLPNIDLEEAAAILMNANHASEREMFRSTGFERHTWTSDSGRIIATGVGAPYEHITLQSSNWHNGANFKSKEAAFLLALNASVYGPQEAFARK